MNKLSFQIQSFDAYQAAYKFSVESPDEFWHDIATSYQWMSPWQSVSSGNMAEGTIKWFEGGKLNITVNCLDRHVLQNPDRVALIWESNEPLEPSIKLTYLQLLERVCAMANVLKSKGVNKGDRVALYMPMIPELLISVLACARIGAVHSVVFAGFSARSLADRILDCTCKLVITADGLFRGNHTLNLKDVVDQALLEVDCVETVLLAKRTGSDVSMNKGRDFWMDDLLKDAMSTCEPEIMDAEDPLFVLYTSGSTGKPKGIVHTCGGYMVYAGYSFANVFQSAEGNVFWCTADLGWVTGHTYLTYGPLLQGLTTVMFEGIPTYPGPSRFWEICDKHSVNQFYTAPTAIRALMQFGTEPIEGANLQTLKVIGSVGEPINIEAWQWYFDHVGKGRCPVVDTWWQTETGGIMISGLGNLSPMKPSFAGLPLPGIQLLLVNEKGEVVREPNKEGLLVLSKSWPSMLRNIYGDHKRYLETYFKPFPGYYFTGDAAFMDSDGFCRIIGRVDDVINVSGHRLGTAEIENAINAHPEVIESAVVGIAHEIKGQCIFAYVWTFNGQCDEELLSNQITELVVESIGKIAKPDRVLRVDALPKTRSGKIMRRILRKIAEGEYANLGDTSTLLDPSVVEAIIAKKRLLK